MLNTVLGIIVALVIVVGIVIAMRPDDFRISRSITIAAPPAAVYAVVNDTRRWNDWSPWSKLDPNAKTTLEGPPTGVGAIFRWEGDNKVGAGMMEITESKPGELVRERLEFLRPFKAVNTVDFTFAPQGAGTLMVWSMYGKNNFMSKAVSLVMDCDKMVGAQFEQGLASLKAIVETGK